MYIGAPRRRITWSKTMSTRVDRMVVATSIAMIRGRKKKARRKSGANHGKRPNS